MKQLRIAAVPYNTTIELYKIKPTDQESLYVFDGFIIEFLAQMLKFSYTILFATEVGDAQSDGNWTGCVGMVQNGESDIAICTAAITEERSKVIIFSQPYIYTPMTFVTDKPQPLPNSYAIIYPFSWQLWLGLIIAFIFMSFFIYMFLGKKETYFTVLIRMFGTLSEQSFRLKSRSFYVKLIIISWITGAMFITYSYKAVLLASFSFPYFSGVYDVKGLSEAAENPSFQCGVWKGSYLYKILTQSDADWISKCIRRTPAVTKYDDFVRDVTYKKAAMAGKIYLARFKRDFFVSDDSFFTAAVAVIVSKTFCCIESLNDIILRMIEAGFMQKYQNDIEFVNILYAEPFDDTNDSPQGILKLSDLFGTFVFLIVGLIFSTLVLAIEIFFYRLQEYRRQNRSFHKNK